MICISRRSALTCAGGKVATSTTLSRPLTPKTPLRKRTSPALGSINRMIERPVVLFPQPLSPTRLIVSPFLIVRSIPSTALIGRDSLRNMPRLTGKYFRSPRTWRRTSSGSMDPLLGNGMMQEARSLVGPGHVDQGRDVFATDRHGVRATRRECATGDKFSRARHRPFDGLKACFATIDDRRDGTHQTLRVGMQGIAVEVADGCAFNDLPAIHDDDI